jgi:hypothetical protein
LQKQAKRELRFLNYKPSDETLGGKTFTSVIDPSKVEGETFLKIDRLTRACFADNKVAAPSDA